MKIVETNISNLYCEEFEINDCESSAEYLRNWTQTNQIRNFSERKKQKDTELCKSMYNQLSQKGQYIVNTTLLDYISEDITTQRFGEFFEKLMDETKDYSNETLSIYKIAKYINAKNDCLTKKNPNLLNNYYYLTVEDLRSKLNSFCQKSKSSKSSELLEKDVCTLLSCEKEVLSKGTGIHYDVNWDYVKDELNKRKLDEQTFYNEVIRQITHCNKCKYNNSCTCKTDIKRFYEYDKYYLAELMATVLDLELDNVLLVQEIMFIDEEFPFDTYFCKLTKDYQIYINNLIRNIYVMENATLLDT